MKYSTQFFKDHADGSRSSADVIAPLIFESIQPRSVLDVGCGVGTWAEAFSRLGADVMGIDGDYVDRSMLRIPADRFKSHDLTEPFNLGRKFDLVISLEVAEHLPQSVAVSFVDTLVRHGAAVMFSAAVPGQGGWHHLNEQWQSYWVEIFANRGYEAADPIRPRVWDDPRVEWWYRQNTLLFLAPELTSERADLQDLVQQASSEQHDIIHPMLYTQHLEDRAHPLRALRHRQVGRLQERVGRALGK